MKRIPRNNAGFEAIDLFGTIGHRLGYQLTDAEGLQRFASAIGEALADAANNPIVVHGRRTERMFGYVLASLGTAILVTQEDAGEVYTQDLAIRVPDYRVHFADEPSLLIEVKNFHGDPFARPFRLHENYMQGLLRYADMSRCELRLAVYWSRLSLWTLIDLSDLRQSNNRRTISFSQAAERNQMHRVGDVLIGTEPPLTLRVIADTDKPRQVEQDGHINFTIAATHLYCGGREIIDDTEKRIALYLIFFGNWDDDTDALIEDGQLVHIDFIARPPEYNEDEGFAMVAHLSTMISHQYVRLTEGTKGVTALAPAVEPGSLGVLIDKHYRGEALRLWRFTVHPKRADGTAETSG
jgi:Holliday junction resolvase